MEQKEKSAQELKALEQVKKAQANLAKVRREEKAKARKEQDTSLEQEFITTEMQTMPAQYTMSHTCPSVKRVSLPLIIG